MFANGMYMVTGQPERGEYTKGHFEFRDGRRNTWRVVNVVTRKLASAEFSTLDEALFHMDSLAFATSHTFSAR